MYLRPLGRRDYGDVAARIFEADPEVIIVLTQGDQTPDSVREQLSQDLPV